MSTDNLELRPCPHFKLVSKAFPLKLHQVFLANAFNGKEICGTHSSTLNHLGEQNYYLSVWGFAEEVQS